MSDFTIEAELPALLLGNVDARGNIIKAQQEATQPVFEVILAYVKNATPYESIREGYYATEEVQGGAYTRTLRNRMPHQIFRERDTIAHDIPGAFGRVGTVRHPGTQGNYIVRDTVAIHKGELEAAARERVTRYARSFGTLAG